MAAVPEPTGTPVALQIRCAALPAAHGPVDPICLLFLDEPGSPLLGVTEWQQASVAPQFHTVLTLAVSPSLQLDSPLRLQVRQVDNQYWDETTADPKAALLAMPLLGDCTFVLREALATAANGLALPLILTAIGTEPFRAAVRVVLPVANEPWSRPSTYGLAHSCVHYCFPATSSSSASSSSDTSSSSSSSSASDGNASTAEELEDFFADRSLS